MKRLICAAAVCLAVSPAWADAPFCVVASFGTQCWYYTMSACQAAAQRVNGACVVNR